MTRTAMHAVSGLMAVVLAASAAAAGETADLQRQLDELKAKVDKLEASKGSPASGKSSWADKVSLFGDFRYRHEQISEPGRDTALPDRERHRIRARLGLKAKVNDEVDLTFRIATGSSTDPVSTNETLDNYSRKKTILLDMAYFDYHPDALKDMNVPLNVLGGKMPVPFITPGGSDLIWDGDLTPEGGALKFAPKLGDMAELSAVLGGFWIEERHTSSQTENNEDAAMFGAQAALKLKFEEKGKVYAQAGVGYFNYTNTIGKGVYGGAFGNNVDGAGNYNSDFDEVEVLFEVGFPVADLPVAIYADFVTNTGAEDNARGDKEDTGYLIGLNVGKIKDQWDWSLGYNYRELEKDCVVGAFTDSDSGGGGTNVRGHKFSGQIALLKNVTAGVSCFINEVNISDTDATDRDAEYHRLQIDLAFKF